MQIPLWNVPLRRKHVVYLALYWLFWPCFRIAEAILHKFCLAVLAFLAIFSVILAIAILWEKCNISGRKPKECERKPKECEKCETYLIEIPWHMSSLATEDN